MIVSGAILKPLLPIPKSPSLAIQESRHCIWPFERAPSLAIQESHHCWLCSQPSIAAHSQAIVSGHSGAPLHNLDLIQKSHHR